MRGRIIFLLAIIFVGCSQDYDAKGIVYSGNANLKIGLSQFIATNAENENEIILNMTGATRIDI
jgi:hypothetical protein